MNIFKHEMKSNLKSLIIWSIGVLLMIVTGMAESEAYIEGTSGVSANEIMDKMPKLMKVIFGIGELDLSTAIGFYGLLFLYLLLMAGIHAVMLGAGIIGKEEADKTAEFLFVKPISRMNVIKYKLYAAVTNIFIFNLVTFIISVIFVVRLANGQDVFGDLIQLTIGMLFLQLLFLAIGVCIASVLQNSKKVTSVSTQILLLTYIIAIFVDMSDKLEFLKIFTPFKYFDANSIINNGLNIGYIVLTIILITGMIYISINSYNKRDLKI